jgi:uncharacterized membrane protein
MVKNILQSKTFWANFMLLLIGFATFVAGEVQAGAVLTGASLVNMFLRWLTTEPISLLE